MTVSKRLKSIPRLEIGNMLTLDSSEYVITDFVQTFDKDSKMMSVDIYLALIKDGEEN